MSKKEDQIDDKSEDVVEESQEEQQNDSDLNNLTYEELLENCLLYTSPSPRD